MKKKSNRRIFPSGTALTFNKPLTAIDENAELTTTQLDTALRFKSLTTIVEERTGNIDQENEVSSTTELFNRSPIEIDEDKNEKLTYNIDQENEVSSTTELFNRSPIEIDEDENEKLTGNIDQQKEMPSLRESLEFPNTKIKNSKENCIQKLLNCLGLSK